MESVKLNSKNIEIVAEKAAGFIKNGKIVVCPTDTIYGLVADATSKKSVEKIFKTKKRSMEKPLPVFIKDMEMAKKIAEINGDQEKFLRKAWPGKTTAVLRRKGKLKIYGVDKNTIAIRIPDDRFVNILLRKLNRPLTGTSANVSGISGSVKIKEVLKQFISDRESPCLVIDAGNLKPSKPSKIIDLTGLKPKILRK